VALDASTEELLAGMCALPLAAARAHPTVHLTDAGAKDARHGRRVLARDILGFVAGPSAWIDPLGDLVAVGEVDETGGKVTRGFGRPTSIGSPSSGLSP
jgi:hypothetical protein